MRSFNLDSFIKGFLLRRELWCIFLSFCAAMAFIGIGFIITLWAVPELDVYAILVPIVPFLGLCAWKLKAYKARVVDPVDDIIRQADVSERVGIFLFLSIFLGSIGWGGSLMLMFVIYTQMSSGYEIPIMFGIGQGLYYGFLLGALMAAFKFADLFKNKKLTYCLYGILVLLFFI